MGGCEQLGIFLNSGQTKAIRKTEQLNKSEKYTSQKIEMCLRESGKY